MTPTQHEGVIDKHRSALLLFMLRIITELFYQGHRRKPLF